MFEGKDHLHAIASAIGTLGGFTPAPVWFRTVVNNSICQILAVLRESSTAISLQ